MGRARAQNLLVGSKTVAGQKLSPERAGDDARKLHNLNHGAPLPVVIGGAPLPPLPPNCSKLPPNYFSVDDQHRGFQRLRIMRLLDILNQRIGIYPPTNPAGIEDGVQIERLHQG